MGLYGFALRLIWCISACAASINSDLLASRETSIVEQNTVHETQLCLSRVASLAKAEGYGALCTSIGALYRQQQNSASSLMALKEEGERMRTANAAVEQENQDLKAQIAELKQQKIKREKEWQTAAKKFQAGVASRDVQWQGTVSRVELAAAKKYQAKLVERDAHWQETVRRLENEKDEVKKQVIDAQKQKEAQMQQVEELQKQKEAIEASTSVGTKSRRTILLALNREKQKSQAESKEVQGLLEQIRALQTENAQLVQKCVAG